MQLTTKNKKLTRQEKMDIIDLKYNMVLKANHRCFRCNKHFTCMSEAQLAHKIPKHISNIKKYGYEVIHHPLNLEVSCNLCNSYAMNGVNRNELENEIRLDLGLEPIKRGKLDK